MQKRKIRRIARMFVPSQTLTVLAAGTAVGVMASSYGVGTRWLIALGVLLLLVWLFRAPIVRANRTMISLSFRLIQSVLGGAVTAEVIRAWNGEVVLGENAIEVVHVTMSGAITIVVALLLIVVFDRVAQEVDRVIVEVQGP